MSAYFRKTYSNPEKEIQSQFKAKITFTKKIYENDTHSECETILSNINNNV